MRVGILTLSDKASRGEREDLSGPALAAWLKERSADVVRMQLLPDDLNKLVGLLAEWSDGEEVDLIVTTGGTGVSSRDVTPEATLKIVDRVLPGFSEAMRAASMKRFPTAMISRAVTGVRKGTLIINLPGSPKGAIENLEVVWPAVSHAIEKIQGDARDCAPSLSGSDDSPE